MQIRRSERGVGRVVACRRLQIGVLPSSSGATLVELPVGALASRDTCSPREREQAGSIRRVAGTKAESGLGVGSSRLSGRDHTCGVEVPDELSEEGLGREPLLPEPSALELEFLELAR